MKKQTANNPEILKEQMIQDALRTSGFIFPQTVAEVEIFEKNFGTTNIPLPDDLKVPNFLSGSRHKKPAQPRETTILCDNFALAAREGAPTLPDEILERMEEDRKKADKKNKKSKKK